jgi:hypothetical protein
MYTGIAVLRCILVVCILSLSACVSRAAWKPLPIALQSSEAVQVLQQLGRQSAELRHAKILYNALIKRGDEVASLRYAIIFEKPQRLRVEVLPLNGFYSLGLFAVSELGSVMLDPSERVATQSNNPQALLARYFYLPLSPAALMHLVAGTLSPETLASGLEVRRSNQGDLVEVRRVDGREVYRFSPELELQSCQFFSPHDDQLVVEANFSDYARHEEILLPQKLQVRLVSVGVDLDLSLSSFKSGTIAPAEQLFNPAIPAGYQTRAAN